jgi:hypothetical protein
VDVSKGHVDQNGPASRSEVCQSFAGRKFRGHERHGTANHQTVPSRCDSLRWTRGELGAQFRSGSNIHATNCGPCRHTETCRLVGPCFHDGLVRFAPQSCDSDCTAHCGQDARSGATVSVATETGCLEVWQRQRLYSTHRKLRHLRDARCTMKGSMSLSRRVLNPSANVRLL